MCKKKSHYTCLVPHDSQVLLLQLCKWDMNELSACAGAVVAAATDLTFSLYGYVAVVINNFLTALYLIMVKNSPATSGLTTTGLLGYNAALSLPLLTAALALSNEPRQISLYPGFRWRGYQVSRLSCLVRVCLLSRSSIPKIVCGPQRCSDELCRQFACCCLPQSALVCCCCCP